MRETRISLPELGLIAGTRAIAGAGLGLLLSSRLSPEQRRAVGWTLLIVGAVSTIPLALEVFGGRRLSERSEERELMEQPSEETALAGLRRAAGDLGLERHRALLPLTWPRLSSLPGGPVFGVHYTVRTATGSPARQGFPH